MNSAISVLIRTFNSAVTLPQVLARLEPQQDDNIIIVDSGSHDATLEIAKKYQAQIIIAEKPFNYSKSLNIGFHAAQTPWVLVLSSHCIPAAPKFLNNWREMIKKFPDQLAVAYGQVILTENEKLPVYRRAFCCLNKFEWKQNKQIAGGNAIALYRRDCWQRRNFNEMIPTGEDLEWLLWALDDGYVMANAPNIKVIYRNCGSLRHMYAKGFSEAKAARKMLESEKISLKHLGIAIGSLVKKLLLWQVSPNVFGKQCAHRLGAFWGSRSCPE